MVNMVFNVHKQGYKEYAIKQVPTFAFLPEPISHPHQGYIWGEFYNKVYEYRNCAWHFEGKLHRRFPEATFTNNEGERVTLKYHKASVGYKAIYFLRRFLILLIWIGVIYGIIYFLHYYFT